MILGFFCIVILIFLALSLLSYTNIKRYYAKRVGDLESRYESLENQYDQVQSALTREQGKTTRQSKRLSEMSLALAEREKFIRLILPNHGITPLEILRMKGMVSEDAIRNARDYIVKSQIIKDVEDVLVEQNIINPIQLQETREIIRRFNNRRRPTRDHPTQ
ncbi:MAG: hypothetical protein ACNI3A_12810 [Desulfovibrio sp.]|uniref:hypothetical protein n=1 Tax=Desulfovibrio sp. 7SRBS1 TaxID=3378064 RepID=UPI003B4165D1